MAIILRDLIYFLGSIVGHILCFESSSKTVLLCIWCRLFVTYRLWFTDWLLLVGDIDTFCCWSSAGRHYSSINRHEFHGHVWRVVWHPADLVWFVWLHLFAQINALSWGLSWCTIDRWSTAGCWDILWCCSILRCRSKLGIICRGMNCGRLFVLLL